MSKAPHDRGPSWFSLHSFKFRGLGLKGKMLVALVPMVVCILILTGLLTYRVSEQYISMALERNVILRDRAMAREMELFLDRCRLDLLFFAKDRAIDPESLRDAFKRMMAAGECPYLEFGYISADTDDNAYFIRLGDEVRPVVFTAGFPPSPNPALYLDDLHSLAPGEVKITGILEIQCPTPTEGMRNHVVRRQAIRLFTRAAGSGIMFLSIPASALRDILTLYNSDRSPLYAFARSNELRFAYMVDTDGWILFQSGEPNGEMDQALATFTARKGYDGTLGRPGHGGAFRPSSDYEQYWEIVNKLRSGEFGKQLIGGGESLFRTGIGHYLAFSPIFFRGDGKDKEVYGGLMYIDRSQLPIVAGYKYLDVMVFVSISTIVFFILFIYFIGRSLTDPIRVLADRMASFKSPAELEEIHLGYFGQDIEMLRDSINGIIRLVRRQLVEIRQKDEAILSVNKREPASMAPYEAALEESHLSLIPEIVGSGPVIAELKSGILKAAQTDVDVLVLGETGTGKQLVAEAIHGLSPRKDGAFISINCGALDENLLLDALFGHVKGAFTEARADRNGAFVEADGGTLFLDEIQVASPKVQQALLRALSMRKIKPLGSDKEIDVNVRIIAATNVNLPDMIEANTFREDLYYRLKVLSIRTPALRNHIESIPILALFYLRQAETLVNRKGLVFSNGALHKLATYSWPGNIRELINCVTRAAVMADNDVIQPEEIRLESDQEIGAFGQLPDEDEMTESSSGDMDGFPDSSPEDHSLLEGDLVSETTNRPEGSGQAREAKSREAKPREPVEGGAQSQKSVPQAELNERQVVAWRLIMTNGSITRSEYQEAAGGIPSRTAIHDLQSMIKMELIVKKGKGPATRYTMASAD